MTYSRTVGQIYEAFGRGDIPAILGHLRQDVEWDHGLADIGVPWLRSRTGHAEVIEFFESLSDLEFRRFEPTVLFEHGDTVVALIDISLVVRATGREIDEEDEVHIWRFDPDGKVRGFRHKLDTHQHWVAAGNH